MGGGRRRKRKHRRVTIGLKRTHYVSVGPSLFTSDRRLITTIPRNWSRTSEALSVVFMVCFCHSGRSDQTTIVRLETRGQYCSFLHTRGGGGEYCSLHAYLTADDFTPPAFKVALIFPKIDVD